MISSPERFFRPGIGQEVACEFASDCDCRQPRLLQVAVEAKPVIHLPHNV